MVFLIRGDVPDINKSHRDLGKKLNAVIHSVYYNAETLKEKIREAGSFDEFMRRTRLNNREAIISMYQKGE